MFTRYLIRFAISAALFLLFLLHIEGVLPINLVTQLENLAYDWRIRVTMPNTVDDRIVIVDIDEKSMSVEGQWPWPRDKLARMVDNLFTQYAVRVVGFDSVFPEADRGAGLDVLEQMAQSPLADDPVFQAQVEAIRPGLERDRIFAESLGHGPVVMGFVFDESTTGLDAGVLPRPVIPKAANNTNLDFIEAGHYGGNLPVLQEAAIHGGFFSNPTVSIDGSYRRVPLLEEYRGDIYQSLALGVLRASLEWPPVEFRFFSEDPAKWNNLDLEWVKIGNLRIPVDEDVALLVPYRGYQYSFPYVSATKVISGTAPTEALRDRIVLVGTSAAGLKDLRVTPVGRVYAGVEVHANIISGILDQRVKQHPEYVHGIHVVTLIAIGILLTWIFTRSQIVTSTLAMLAVLTALIVVNLAMWEYENFVIPLAASLLFTVLLFVGHMVYGFFIESRGKRQLSNLFGQYVPPELVEEMAANPEQISLEGQNREMTVLFSDVRDFTSISEGLSATELAQMMNEYLTAMTRAIHDQRGTIDKYIGDAIMSFWGAPLADPDHASHAVAAALRMTETAARLSAEFRKKGWPEIRIGVGLNTGPMNVGNMGSKFRMAYTVMGDAVNLGSRLEGLTKHYGVSILVSESTREQAPDVQFLELDRVRVKGKEKPVAIFEPLGLRSQLDKNVRSLITRHKQALRLFREQRWDAAEQEFFMLQQADSKRKIYQLYLERIQRFRQQSPGAAWDGVTVYETK